MCVAHAGLRLNAGPVGKRHYSQLRDPSYQNPKETLPAHHLRVYLDSSCGFRLVSAVKILSPCV